MTVVKSNLVTNADAGTSNHSGQYAVIKGFSARYAAAGVIADNTVLLLGEIPVDADITSVIFSSDDLGTTGTFNLGFYPGPGSDVTIADDTDAVDEDALATAIDVNAAAVANSEVRFEVANIDGTGKKAWELAGLTTRPDYATFYLALTAAAATTAAGDIAVRVMYRD